MPEDEPLTVLLPDREQIQLPSEAAVIAPLRLLSLAEPRLQLGESREGGAVDALHLRPLRVAFPVGAREREEAEGVEPVGARHVRTETEVHEWGAVDAVEAHPLAALVLDQLALQGLAALREEAQHRGLRRLLAAVGEAALDELAHPPLDRRQVALGERAGRDHVVEEAEARLVQQRRTDPELRPGEQIEHRRGQEVCGRVPQHLEPVARGCQDGLDLHGRIAAGRLEAEREIHLAPVDPGGQGLPGEVGGEPPEDLPDGGASPDPCRRRAFDRNVDVVHRFLP